MDSSLTLLSSYSLQLAERERERKLASFHRQKIGLWWTVTKDNMTFDSGKVKSYYRRYSGKVDIPQGSKTFEPKVIAAPVRVDLTLD